MLRRGGCGAGSGRAPELPSPQTEPEPHRPAGEAPGRDGLFPFTGFFWSLSAPPLPACSPLFSLPGRFLESPRPAGDRAWWEAAERPGILHRRAAALMQPGLAGWGLPGPRAEALQPARTSRGLPGGCAASLSTTPHPANPGHLCSDAQGRPSGVRPLPSQGSHRAPGPCTAQQPGPPARRP